MKGNYSELALAQKFRLNKATGFQWLGECDITPDDIISFNAKKARDDMKKVDAGAEFLRELLSEGEMPSSDVIKIAASMGYKDKTFERAKEKAKVISLKPGKHWVMLLGDEDDDNVSANNDKTETE